MGKGRLNYGRYGNNMDASSFWNVIAEYNTHTLYVQGLLFLLILASLILAYTRKIYFLPKIALGITLLFIGIVFFLYYGTEPIQTFFAAPLFILSGTLFTFEAIKNKADKLERPRKATIILFVIVLLYPLVSYLLGNVYPATVLLIMPCPLVSMSILIYACYAKKNKVLLILLVVWGLTGIKSLFFNAYEDLILLLCGFYGIYVLISSSRRKKGLYTASLE